MITYHVLLIALGSTYYGYIGLLWLLYFLALWLWLLWLQVGNVKTDHILFIASGAFHFCKPSDLLAELQGRLPIRVELKPLSEVTRSEYSHITLSSAW